MRNWLIVQKITLAVFLGLFMASCSQDDSDDLGDSPFYQSYKVSVSADKVVAYAHFSKKTYNPLNSIKLTGDQNLKVNSHEVDYGIDLEGDESYPYSYNLGNYSGTVEFALTRTKTKVLKNSVNTNDIKAFTLGEVTNAEGNAQVEWLGDDQDGTTVSAQITTSSDGGYSANILEIIGHVIMIGDLKGTLIVKRSKTISTTENDTPAGGNIVLDYRCTKTIQ